MAGSSRSPGFPEQPLRDRWYLKRSLILAAKLREAQWDGPRHRSGRRDRRSVDARLDESRGVRGDAPNAPGLLLTAAAGTACGARARRAATSRTCEAIYLDCDADTVLLKVRQRGGAACHEGYKSCFFRELDGEGSSHRRSSEIDVFDPNARWIKKSMTDRTGVKHRIWPKRLRLGLPSGSLQQATMELFRKAGYSITQTSRSYYPQIDDPEISCTLLRAQEMARYVDDGVLDCGLTGYDWIVESGADVIELGELVLSKASRRPVRWVLAVPVDSPIQSVKDLEGKRIATEVVNLTNRWLAEHGVDGAASSSVGARPRSSRRSWPTPSSR